MDTKSPEKKDPPKEHRMLDEPGDWKVIRKKEDLKDPGQETL